MVSFELGKEIEKDFFFVLSRAWDKEKMLSPHVESEDLRFYSSWGIRIFSLSHARDKTKKHLSRWNLFVLYD